MKYARASLLQHFGEKTSGISKEMLARLKKHNNKVFVLIRCHGKSRGCYSGGGESLPLRLSSAMKNSLSDKRYGGAFTEEELPHARLELFVLQTEIPLVKDYDKISESVRLGIDSIRLSAKIGGKTRHATFLNYVPITSGYSLGRVLDRLAQKADIESAGVPFLQKMLGGTTDESLQAYAALAKYADEARDLLPALVDLAGSDSSAKRLNAVTGLAHLSRSARRAKSSSRLRKTYAAHVLPALAAALKDEGPEVRRTAAFGLRNFGSGARDLASALGVVATTDTSTEVKSEAAKALLQMAYRDPKSLDIDGLPTRKRLMLIAAEQPKELRLKSIPDVKTGLLGKAVLASPETSAFLVPTIHLLETASPERVVQLHRCNTFVKAEDVNAESVTRSVKLGGQWLLNAQRWNGALEYMWFVNSGSYSTSNNMIRQWMSTFALHEIGSFLDDDRYFAAARKNVAYNLDTYYRDNREKDIGFIQYRGKCKLGSAAFAVRSLLHIDKEGRYSKELGRLKNFTKFMFRKDGSFRSIYYPEREDSFSDDDEFLQRYYSGEGLVALMDLYETLGDNDALAMVGKAFEYHRDYYNTDKHPASIPWLTQAYARAWRVERRPEYADFIFKMNDFIVSIQNQELYPDKDHLGRFSSDEWSKIYGPPFAPSTGVYLEGVVDAYRVARELKDVDRMEKYRIAIVLACRSLMQLQFRDDNLFFAKDAFRTRGGIRGDVMSTTIRMDNVQHSMQGMLRAVQTLTRWDLPKKFWSM